VADDFAVFFPVRSGTGPTVDDVLVGLHCGNYSCGLLDCGRFVPCAGLILWLADKLPDPGSESEPGAPQVLKVARVICAMHAPRELSRNKTADVGLTRS
jgi:hypothetical protein